jgi:glutaredoxin 3
VDYDTALLRAAGFGSETTACEVIVLDMRDPEVARRAKSLGIRSVPAVVIDGTLAEYCAGRGPDEQTLRTAGLGQPLP